MTNEPIIQVRGLTARYGDATIFQDINFDVRRGEIFVILGGSGCGKSTLLKHLVGLYQPAAGKILIDGDDIATAQGEPLQKIQRKFGILFQSGALLGSMTLAQNVALPLEEYTKLSEQAIGLLVRMKLNMVALSGYENHLPSEISGGMKKRAGLARALALDPAIVFFDEPSAGLDPVTSRKLDELVLQVRETIGTTIVIVSHELASIYGIADRVIMLDRMHKGIIAEGTPRDLAAHSRDPRVTEFLRFSRGENLRLPNAGITPDR